MSEDDYDLDCDIAVKSLLCRVLIAGVLALSALCGFIVGLIS